MVKIIRIIKFLLNYCASHTSRIYGCTWVGHTYSRNFEGSQTFTRVPTISRIRNVIRKSIRFGASSVYERSRGLVLGNPRKPMRFRIRATIWNFITVGPWTSVISRNLAGFGKFGHTSKISECSRNANNEISYRIPPIGWNSTPLDFLSRASFVWISFNSSSRFHFFLSEKFILIVRVFFCSSIFQIART